MAYTDATFPNSVQIFTDKVNEVDDVDASHVNSLQDEVMALQTYMGTNPHGSKSSLADRVYVCIGTDGATRKGSSFPTNPVDGQQFWRSDEESHYVYGSVSGTWKTSQTLSNHAFSYTGAGVSSGSFASRVTNGTSITPSISGTYASFFAAAAAAGGAKFSTCILGRFRKIAGMTTLTYLGYAWQSAGSGNSAKIRVTIGSVSGTVQGAANRATPEALTGTLDLSGLANGTTYTLVIEIGATGAVNCYLGSIDGFIT